MIVEPGTLWLWIAVVVRTWKPSSRAYQDGSAWSVATFPTVDRPSCGCFLTTDHGLLWQRTTKCHRYVLELLNMPRTRSGKSTHKAKKRRSCCKGAIHAACKGHYDCYVLFHPRGYYRLLYDCLHAALRHGHMDFTRNIIDNHRANVMELAQCCIKHNDLVSLRKAVSFNSAVLKLSSLTNTATSVYSASCLEYLLENGARWAPNSLFWALLCNRMDVLEVVLRHSREREWHPQLPGVAAISLNVGFLMRIFAAGCPSWKSARDGEPDCTG